MLSHVRLSRSNLAWSFHQQASLYRGGYNRFTPYWHAQQSGGWVTSPPFYSGIGWCCRTDEILNLWKCGFTSLSLSHPVHWETKQTEVVNRVRLLVPEGYVMSTRWIIPWILRALEFTRCRILWECLWVISRNFHGSNCTKQAFFVVVVQLLLTYILAIFTFWVCVSVYVCKGGSVLKLAETSVTLVSIYKLQYIWM